MTGYPYSDKTGPAMAPQPPFDPKAPEVSVLDWWRWRVIRAEMARRINAKRGTSQKQVATRAGLDQGQVSKMLLNQNLGPAVETFMRMIQGLGLKPSEFFAELERGWTSDTPVSQGGGPAENRDEEGADVERAIGRIVLRAVGKALEETKRKHRRA